MKHNRAALCDGVDVLGESPFGIGPNEHQHVSCSLVSRMHPDCGTESICVRGFTHTMRHILPIATGVEKKLERATAKLVKLSGKMVQKCGPRQMFCRSGTARGHQTGSRL